MPVLLVTYSRRSIVGGAGVLDKHASSTTTDVADTRIIAAPVRASLRPAESDSEPDITNARQAMTLVGIPSPSFHRTVTLPPRFDSLIEVMSVPRRQSCEVSFVSQRS